MNLFMTFHYDGQDEPARLGYIITQKAFDTFIGSNQPDYARFSEEEVKFPYMFMGGETRQALVHYLRDEKFACYVPIFATESEVETYSEAFGR